MRFRRLNKWYANLMGFYWLPCPVCGQMYGGHEAAGNVLENGTPISDMVCKDCNKRVLKINTKRSA